MDNLFRIDKNNMENFLNVYETNKNIKKINKSKSEQSISKTNIKSSNQFVINKISKKILDEQKKNKDKDKDKDKDKVQIQHQPSNKKISKSDNFIEPIWKFGKTTIKIDKIKKKFNYFK